MRQVSANDKWNVLVKYRYIECLNLIKTCFGTNETVDTLKEIMSEWYLLRWGMPFISASLENPIGTSYRSHKTYNYKTV